MKSGSDISMKPDADMVMRKLAQITLFCKDTKKIPKRCFFALGFNDYWEIIRSSQ